MKNFLKISVKILIWLISLLAVSFVGLLIYISFNPLSLERFLPSGQGPLNWNRTRFEYSSLELLFERGLLIRAKDGRLISEFDEKEIRAELGELYVHLSISELLHGRVAPERIIARAISLPMELKQEGLEIAGVWLGRSGESHEKFFDLVEYLNYIQHSDNKLPAELSKLSMFKIEDANIIFDDQIHAATWHGKELGISFDNSQKEILSFTVRGTLSRGESQLPISLRLEHLAGEEKAEIELSASFSGLESLEGYLADEISQILKGQTKIKATTVLRSGNTLDPSKLKLHSSNGRLKLPRVFSHPIDYSLLEVTASYDPRDDERMLVENLLFVDQHKFSIQGEGEVKSLGQVPHIKLLFKLSPTTVDHLANFIPDVRTPNLQAWLDTNLNYAQISNARMEIVGPLADFPFAEANDATKFHAQFDFQGLEVLYSEGFPPGKSLDGRFEMNRGVILITAQAGKLGMQEVSDLEVEISDVFKAGEPTVLAVQGVAAGSVENVLSNFLSGMDNPPTLRGTQRADVRLSLPLKSNLSPEEILCSVRSKVRNVGMVLADSSLRFDAPSLDVQVSEKGFRISGNGNLNGAPVSIKVQENVKELASGTQVHLETTLKREFYGRFLREDLMNVEGPIPLSLDVGKDGRTNYAYRASLDLKNAKLTSSGLDWDKAAGVPAALALEGEFLPVDRLLDVRQATLSAPKLEIRGEAKLPLKDLANSELELKPFRIGGTDLEIAYKQGHVSVGGRVLDKRSVGMRSGAGETPDVEAVDLGLAIEKVLLEAGTLKELKGKLLKKDKSWEVFEIDSKISKNGTARLRLEEENGSPLLHLTSNDAAEMLRLLGAEDEYRGGELRGYLRFPEGAFFDFEKVEGHLALDNIHVVQSQTIFQILSYFSLQNWLSSHEGVMFRRVRVPIRIENEVLYFGDSRLEGPVVTIYFNGTVNTKTGRIKISGQAVPLSNVGRIARNVPLVGRTLSNIQRRLASARFTVSGTADNVRVRLFGVKVPQ